MKTLEFIYQETQIHFTVNPFDKSVMVNATEMAKNFGKRTDHYLQNESTKEFIKALEKLQKTENLNDKVPEMSGTLIENNQSNFGQIIENRGRNGIYFCELLSIDFATWLDVDFKVWVYQRIQDVIFGNYKKHWEAHAQQEIAKIAMENLKKDILKDPTPATVAEYFKHEREFNEAKSIKYKAIRNQLKLFGSE